MVVAMVVVAAAVRPLEERVLRQQVLGVVLVRELEPAQQLARLGCDGTLPLVAARTRAVAHGWLARRWHWDRRDEVALAERTLRAQEQLVVVVVVVAAPQSSLAARLGGDGRPPPAGARTRPVVVGARALAQRWWQPQQPQQQHRHRRVPDGVRDGQGAIARALAAAPRRPRHHLPCCGAAGRSSSWWWNTGGAQYTGWCCSRPRSLRAVPAERLVALDEGAARVRQ